MQSMDWIIIKTSGREVLRSSMLVAAMFFVGCRPNSDPAVAVEKVTLRPGELVNTCAVVMLGNEPQGTGFFVTHCGIHTSAAYFVTARHIAEKLVPFFEQWPQLELRVKRQGGNKSGLAYVPLQRKKNKTFWIQHPYSNADLAVFPVPNFVHLQNEEFDIRPIVFTNGRIKNQEGRNKRCKNIVSVTLGLLTAQYRQTTPIEPGCEVFAYGTSPELSKCFTDETESTFTLRKGIISATPSCEVNYKYGPTRLLVIDCPVIGGNSGGPVFVWNGENQGGRVRNRDMHLLGIVSSFVRDREIYHLPSEEYPFVENSGLSFITPVDYLTEILSGLEEVLD